MHDLSRGPGPSHSLAPARAARLVSGPEARWRWPDTGAGARTYLRDIAKTWSWLKHGCLPAPEIHLPTVGRGVKPEYSQAEPGSPGATPCHANPPWQRPLMSRGQVSGPPGHPKDGPGADVTTSGSLVEATTWRCVWRRLAHRAAPTHVGHHVPVSCFPGHFSLMVSSSLVSFP